MAGKNTSKEMQAAADRILESAEATISKAGVGRFQDSSPRCTANVIAGALLAVVGCTLSAIAESLADED